MILTRGRMLRKAGEVQALIHGGHLGTEENGAAESVHGSSEVGEEDCDLLTCQPVCAPLEPLRWQKKFCNKQRQQKKPSKVI